MAQKPVLDIKKYLYALWRSIWLFPVLLLIPLIIFTAFKIHGSSIGIYSLVYGAQNEDNNFFAGAPRGVRSDEWLVSTQLSIAQSAVDYDPINKNIGNGQNSILIGDLPTKEWSTIFKPQDWGFFFLPFEQAYAFKWWFLGIVLCLSAYFFSLEVFSRKILFSILFSLVVLLSPILMWWYSSGVILPLAYSFLIAVCVLRFLNANAIHTRIKYSLCIAYLAVAFVMIMYPPFQIPAAIVLLLFIIGYSRENLHLSLAKIKKLLPYIALILGLVALISFGYYHSNKNTIKRIVNTEYPGARIELSGGVDPIKLFSSFLAPNLQDDNKASSGYFRNQSEASNFLLIAPFLILPSLLMLLRGRNSKIPLPLTLMLMNTLIIVFLVRMVISTPFLEPIYRLLLLDKVPSTRLIYGLGFAGFLQMLLLIKYLISLDISRKVLNVVGLSTALTAAIVFVGVGIYTINKYPFFIASYPKILIYAFWVSLGVYLLLIRRFNAGLLVLIAFSLLAVYRIHPIYRGLYPAVIKETISTIKEFPADANWIVLNDRLLINFPPMAGRPSLSGVYLYPQLDLWHALDPQGNYRHIYNRYAHILFSNEINEDFKLLHADTVLVKFEPCGEFIRNNARYVLTSKQISINSCIRYVRQVSPSLNLYIYEISK